MWLTLTIILTTLMALGTLGITKYLAVGFLSAIFVLFTEFKSTKIDLQKSFKENPPDVPDEAKLFKLSLTLSITLIMFMVIFGWPGYAINKFVSGFEQKGTET